MKKNKKVLDSMREKIPSKIISWQAPEFLEYKKNISWYLILITLGIILSVIFYYTNNLLAIIMVILAVIVIIITASQKPKKRLYRLSKEGLKVNETFYPLDNFKSFFVTYVENVPQLHLEKVKKFSLPLDMFLTGVEENEVVNFIKLYLPENTKIKITTSDLFSRWFKF